MEKKKFSSVGVIPNQKSCSAKLTKVPGLNIWRLDFSKSGSVRTGRRASWWQRFILTLVLATTLALIVTGIAVLVHAVKGGLIFGIPWFAFENGNTNIGVKQVSAHFRIMNRNFIPELANVSSEVYRQLVAELRHSLDVVFVDSSIVNYYNASEGFQFSNGSLVVECIILLNRPVLDGSQAVGFAFLHALEKGKGILPPGTFYIDVHTVTFAAVTQPIDENVLQDLEGLEPWSEWSSCTSDVCDSRRIRVRRRKCRTKICGEDTEIVETKPCTCPPLAEVSVSPFFVFSRVWSKWGPWSPCPKHSNCDINNNNAIQRRTRRCLSPGSRTLPGFVCSRGMSEVGTQIRHCACESIASE